MAPPVAVPSGTYAVMYQGNEIYRGSYRSAKEYIDNIQSGISVPLTLSKINIHFD